MEKLELYGDINEKGEFTLHNRQRFAEWCRQNPKKNISVKFERRSTKRSDPQNKYYWAVVIKEIGIRLRELGHNWLEDDDVHDMMKIKFNYERVVSEHGEAIELPKSTTQLTKTEFAEYIERIRMWAADFLEIYIPDAGEKLSMNF